MTYMTYMMMYTVYMIQLDNARLSISCIKTSSCLNETHHAHPSSQTPQEATSTVLDDTPNSIALSISSGWNKTIFSIMIPCSMEETISFETISFFHPSWKSMFEFKGWKFGNPPTLRWLSPSSNEGQATGHRSAN